MQIPDIYALEHLSDEEFWDLAFTKAFSASSSPSRTPFAHLSPDTPSMSAEQQEAQLSPETLIVCDDAYAFPLNALYEIISAPQHITFLPDSPPWMMGLIAWRGRVLATIDLRAYLHTMSNNNAGSDLDMGVGVLDARGDLGVIELRPYHTLLIAHHANTCLALAATVSTIGQAGNFSGLDSSDSFNNSNTISTIHPSYTLLDMSALFEDIVKHLEKTVTHE